MAAGPGQPGAPPYQQQAARPVSEFARGAAIVCNDTWTCFHPHLRADRSLDKRSGAQAVPLMTALVSTGYASLSSKGLKTMLSCSCSKKMAAGWCRDTCSAGPSMPAGLPSSCQGGLCQDSNGRHRLPARFVRHPSNKGRSTQLIDYKDLIPFVWKKPPHVCPFVYTSKVTHEQPTGTEKNAWTGP